MEEPAGSLQPITTTNKWFQNIDGAALSQLQGIAKEINKTIDTTVKHVARGKIRVGKLLGEARVFFSSDQAFGQWRKENTPIQSKQHAHYLMKVAERFADAPALIDGVNYSVLQELITAEPHHIEWVEARIAAGDPPTVGQTRAVVKDLPPPPKKGRKATVGSGAGFKRGIKNDRPSIPVPNMEINSITQMPLNKRIKEVIDLSIKGLNAAYLILGLDPDPSYPMHPDNLEAIRNMLIGEVEELEDTIEDAYQTVVEEFKDWS
jgi:hypothetical protein